MHRLKAKKKKKKGFITGLVSGMARERERSATRLDEVQPLLHIFDQLIDDEGRNEWRRRFATYVKR